MRHRQRDGLSEHDLILSLDLLMASMLGRLDKTPTVKYHFHTELCPFHVPHLIIVNHGRIFVGDHTPKLGFDLTKGISPNLGNVTFIKA